ncbi:hypothetical protein AVEN_21950-1 [Araneus ventricosus]|uniref:Uncharacterized protein n=1 Tax=Araneus ventricosus TaxID=182803 RepID=A0A4Y2UX08_ARAVE|nr:hypothetical protein AVEN_21950-1 [Araneus ventricosus]
MNQEPLDILKLDKLFVLSFGVKFRTIRGGLNYSRIVACCAEAAGNGLRVKSVDTNLIINKRTRWPAGNSSSLDFATGGFEVRNPPPPADRALVAVKRCPVGGAGRPGDGGAGPGNVF